MKCEVFFSLKKKTKKQFCKHKTKQFCAKPKKGQLCLFRQDNKLTAEIYTNYQCILCQNYLLKFILTINAFCATE